MYMYELLHTFNDVLWLCASHKTLCHLWLHSMYSKRKARKKADQYCIMAMQVQEVQRAGKTK